MNILNSQVSMDSGIEHQVSIPGSGAPIPPSFEIHLPPHAVVVASTVCTMSCKFKSCASATPFVFWCAPNKAVLPIAARSDARGGDITTSVDHEEMIAKLEVLCFCVSHGLGSIACSLPSRSPL